MRIMRTTLYRHTTRHVPKWLIVIGLWLIAVSAPCAAVTMQPMKSASWGYTSSLTGSTPTYSGSTPTYPGHTGSSTAVAPSYHFYSTSSYQSVVGNTHVHELTNNSFEGAPGGIRRGGNPWDEDEPGDDDDPVGQKPDPMPIGSPLVLLLFAVGFVCAKRNSVFRRFWCKNPNK